MICQGEAEAAPFTLLSLIRQISATRAVKSPFDELNRRPSEGTGFNRCGSLHRLASQQPALPGDFSAKRH